MLHVLLELLERMRGRSSAGDGPGPAKWAMDAYGGGSPAGGSQGSLAGHWTAGYGDGGGCIGRLVKSWSGESLGAVACKYEVHGATGQSIDSPLLTNKLLEGKLRVVKLIGSWVANAESSAVSELSCGGSTTGPAY